MTVVDHLILLKVRQDIFLEDIRGRARVQGRQCGILVEYGEGLQEAEVESQLNNADEGRTCT